MACRRLLALLLSLTLLGASLAQAQDVCMVVQPRVGTNLPHILRNYANYSSGSTYPSSTTAGPMRIAWGQKQIADAALKGLPFARFFTIPFAASEVGVWATDPTTFWARMDQFVSDAAASGLQLVPVLFASLAQWAWYTDGTVHDMVTNASSPTQILALQFVTDFVTRYRHNAAILFWEICNECNLYQDLDQDTRQASTWAANGCPATGHNVTTDEMKAFLLQVAVLIESLDHTRPISYGYTLPRIWAEHMRALPEFSGGPDFTHDSQAQFEFNLIDTNVGADIISIHIYNDYLNGVSGQRNNELFGATGITNVEFMRVIKAAADVAGKPVFVAEFGDGSPALDTDPDGLFTQAMLTIAQELAIPWMAPWAWEFYQTNPWTPYQRSMEPGLTDTIIGKLGDFNTAFGLPPPTPSDPDTVAPTTILTYPYTDTTVSASQRLHAVASDDTAVTKVEFLVDGVVVNTDTVAPYDYTYSTTGLTAGSHTIAAKGYDAAGNTSTYTITVTK